MKYILKISFFVLLFSFLCLVFLRWLGLQRGVLPSQETWFEKEGKKFWLVAEGGGKGLGPSYCKQTLRKTQKLSPQIVLEIELKRTFDGEWILYAEDRLEVQTEEKGFVSWKKWEEIKGLNLGFFFQNEKGEFPFRKKGKKCHFILFKDFLKNHKKTFLLKISLRDTYGLNDLIEMIEKQKAQSRIVFSLTSMSAYKYIKTQRPHWNFISSLSQVPFVLMMESLFLEPLLNFKEPVFFSPLKLAGRQVFSKPLVSELKRRKIKIFVKLDDSFSSWPLFAEGVITPRPDKFLDFIRKP